MDSYLSSYAVLENAEATDFDQRIQISFYNNHSDNKESDSIDVYWSKHFEHVVVECNGKFYLIHDSEITALGVIDHFMDVNMIRMKGIVGSVQIVTIPIRFMYTQTISIHGSFRHLCNKRQRIRL